MSESERTFVKYSIKIVRTDKQYVEDQDYQKISDTGNERDRGAVYGYVKHTVARFVETDLLKQEITDETLDIKSVIKAINGL